MRHLMLDTFTGSFAVIEEDDGSLRTGWVDADMRRMLRASRLDRGVRPDVVRRLRAYFDGKAVDFGDIELGETSSFQRRCWEACRRIPRGVTITYAQLADRAGSRTAFRAAGQAMRNNRLPIIVPCHRVIASGGGLHGFAGTTDQRGHALSIKRGLLQMEGALADEESPIRRASKRRRTAAAARA